MRRKLFFFAPLAIVAFAAFIALGGAVVRLLWNWLLPPLAGWPPITFWQALALLALCRILFGGHGWHRGRRFGWRGRTGDRMADHLGRRWARMSPEERERFRERLRERFGIDAAPGAGSGPAGAGAAGPDH